MQAQLAEGRERAAVLERQLAEAQAAASKHFAAAANDEATEKAVQQVPECLGAIVGLR